MKKCINSLILPLMLSSQFLITSCSDKGITASSGSTAEILSSAQVGIEVPSSVNTVPTSTSEALIAALEASPVSAIEYLETTDFDKLGDPELKISNPALDQFGIVEEILSAFEQTGYADPRAVNQGPYEAMIKWASGDGSVDTEVWTLDSKMIVLDGNDVNRVRFWINEPDQVVKGILDIHEAPSASNKYGVWRIDVGFYNTSGIQQGNFVGKSEMLSDGTVRLGVNETGERAMKGVLYLKNATGRGMVSFPDFWGCQSQPCPTVVSQYAYDTNHLTYKRGDDLFCKNRTSYADIFMDYEIFDASGTNVRKANTFSFPLKSSDGKWYYYGGWNGRQQLWGPDGTSLVEGTVLSHGEYGNNSTFTVSKQVSGTLVKQSKASVTAPDLTGKVLEINTDQDDWFIMAFSAGAWKRCNSNDLVWSNFTCGSVSATTVDVAGGDIDFSSTKRVQVTAWGDENWSNINVSGDPGNLDTSRRYNVYISTPTFIRYSGAAWQKYNTVDFSGNAYDPELSNLVAYSFPASDRYYWARMTTGTQYVFDISGAGAIESITMEKETIMKPGDNIPGNFCPMTWDNGTQIADCGSATYTWDSTDAVLENGGSTLTTSQYELINTTDNFKYRWDYNNWSKLTYLTYAANPPAGKNTGDTVILAPAISFDEVTGKKLDDSSMPVAGLSFDGHLFGYTDVWQLLNNNRSNNSEAGLSPADKAKIVNFPSNTTITGNSGATSYKIKPRRGMRILDNVALGSCSTSVDTSITLNDAPIFSFPGTMGDFPSGTILKVIEGVYVEDNF